MKKNYDAPKMKVHEMRTVGFLLVSDPTQDPHDEHVGGEGSGKDY